MKQTIRSLPYVAALLLVNGGLGWAQDHAPSRDQCRADYRLWFESYGHSDKSKDPPVQQIAVMMKEMGACASADPKNHVAYLTLSEDFLGEYDLRFAHFIERHNEKQQFLDEDAEGLR
jgi:hypothetical protein